MHDDELFATLTALTGKPDHGPARQLRLDHLVGRYNPCPIEQALYRCRPFQLGG